MIYKIKGINLSDMTEKNIEFYLDINENLDIGDFCLIRNKNRSYENNLTDCTVCKIIDKLVFYDEDDITLNYDYVTKINLNEYIEKKEKEKKIKYIEKILEEKTKNINKYVAFENLAKYDEDSKKLFEKYKKLINLDCNNLIDDKVDKKE